MRDLTRLGAGLATAATFVALVGIHGCVHDDDSCGGPTSDFPYCGGPTSDSPEAPARDPYSKGDPVDLDGDGSSDGVAVDANDDGAIEGVDTNGDGSADAPLPGPRDGGVGDSSTIDGGAACNATCEGASIPLNVSGTTPAGAIKVDSVALAYVGGLTYGTQLRFALHGPGQSQLIQAQLPGHTGDMSSSVALPGVYGAAGDDPAKSAEFRYGECGALGGELAASLEIFEHREVALKAGGEGVLRGELRLDAPGWDLTVPFTITRACAREVDL